MTDLNFELFLTKRRFFQLIFPAAFSEYFDARFFFRRYYYKSRSRKRKRNFFYFRVVIIRILERRIYFFRRSSNFTTNIFRNWEFIFFFSFFRSIRVLSIHDVFRYSIFSKFPFNSSSTTCLHLQQNYDQIQWIFFFVKWKFFIKIFINSNCMNFHLRKKIPQFFCFFNTLSLILFYHYFDVLRFRWIKF